MVFRRPCKERPDFHRAQLLERVAENLTRAEIRVKDATVAVYQHHAIRMFLKSYGPVFHRYARVRITYYVAPPGETAMCYDPNMEIEEIRAHCLSLPEATYDFPFDAETCVFRVGGKMFALLGINGEPPHVSLKCDPDLSRDLRAAFEGIVPGYHLNKEHWNTVATRSDVPPEKVRWLIDHSYQLVRASLPKNRRPVVH
jgi:predicted DNA-binding protein (MmcQ/YjbR family)